MAAAAKKKPKQNGKPKPKTITEKCMNLKVKHLFFLIVTVALLAWGFSVYNASKDPTPQATAPQNEAPKETVSKDEPPKETAQKDEPPKETAPKDEPPKDTAPKEEPPKDTDPKEEVPLDEPPPDADHQDVKHVVERDIKQQHDDEVESSQQHTDNQKDDDHIKEEPKEQPSEEAQEVQPQEKESIPLGDRPVEEALAGQGHEEAPGGQGHEAAPAGQGHEEAPAGQGHEEAPAAQGHEETPAGKGDEEAPAGQGHEEAAAAQGHEDAPAAQGHEEAPAAQGHEEAPVGQAHEEAPAGQAHEDAPAGQAHEEAPAGQVHEEAPAGQGHEEVPAAQGHEEAPAAQGHEEAPAAQGHEEAPAAQGHEEDPAAQGHEDAPAEQGHEEAPVGHKEAPVDQIEAPVGHEEAPVDLSHEAHADHGHDEVHAAQDQETGDVPVQQTHDDKDKVQEESNHPDAQSHNQEEAPEGQDHSQGEAPVGHIGEEQEHHEESKPDSEETDHEQHAHEAREPKFDINELKSILAEKAKPFFQIPQLSDASMQIKVNTSDNTDLFRDVPDTRNLACKLTALGYKPDHLPSVSIVIPFHRESWSVLLRTINSVLLRTPPKLLKEILLIDDWCDLDEIKQPLFEYVSTVPIIKIIKTSSHMGVAKAKMLGARHATAEVIVFMDAQVEVNHQWLEPLLTELEKDAAVMVTPVIDYIYPDTFEYEGSTALQSAGSIDWRLSYVWKTFLSDSLGHRNPEDVLWTESALGAVAAVNREFFFQIGGFDEGMAHRDGDNVEIALRYWMCGNGVQIHPCSHAGHLFRHRLQYVVPSYVDTIHKNRQRIAEVFLYDYKNTFYQLNRYIPFTEQEEEKLLNRVRFHDSLNCRSFEWYLENVAFDLAFPPKNVAYFGQLESRATKECATGSDAGKMASMRDCSYRSKLQTISLLSNGNLILNDLCLSTTGEPNVWQVYQENCKENSTRWHFEEGAPTGLFPLLDYRPYQPSGTLHVWNPHTDKPSELCLEVVVNPEDETHVVGIQDCNTKSKFQYWQFTHKIEQDEEKV
ncbi:uncharacterized protein LOC106168054 [Lingula anatina]|uniref:Uncharacterized protein LOC106168054 n=1 Tax=Lingula anatina TaxID=7574 RepID=A0A1S3IWU1_LINAN|nr:uncharacterized protein LOC106168054 [Lingula anatina]|eukprot:XP_013402436.1 uncharacterized protein LOC106168054 [Lingula anatina]